MHDYFNYKSTDEEKRYLRIKLDQVQRSVKTHKKKYKEKNEELSELKKTYKKQQEMIEKLQKENDELKKQRDTYKNMLFKKNVDTTSLPTDSELLIHTPQRKRGGQNGHKGYGRTLPRQIDSYKQIYLKACPTCHTRLQRSKTMSTHTVEDIPEISLVKPYVTRYTIERQWCRTCKKEVKAIPQGVVPASRLGINLITYIMILKYGARVPFDTVTLLLNTQYHIKISRGGIVHILHRAKEWLGPQYEKLKTEIRASPVVHADETGWRIEGINKWIWTFLKDDAVCYQIEESRGKGVPQDFLRNSNPHAVLVRDDYGAYQKIPLAQQSCWAHMLRKSHEATEQKHSSNEVRELHKRLKNIYEVLNHQVQKPFNLSQRIQVHKTLLQEIQTIIRISFKSIDALHIQTRVRNQNRNLLTALFYPNIPLTNNHAERNLRPLVVTRKISGGSRSPQGAITHMTNMSIFQTIKLKNQPLVSTLKYHLLNGIFGNN